jgi:hypothetical protein
MKFLKTLFLLFLIMGCSKSKDQPLSNYITTCGYGNISSQYYGCEIDNSIVITGSITNSNKDVLITTYSFIGEKNDEISIDLGFDETGVLLKKVSNNFMAIIGNQEKGDFNTDGFLIIVDAKGNVLSKTFFGGEKLDRVSDFLEIAENHFLVLGETNSYSSLNKQILLVEINLNNDLVETKNLNISSNPDTSIEGGTSIVMNNAGEVFVFGYTQSTITGDRDFTFGKLNENLNFEFDTVFHFNDYQEGQKMILMPNGNFCLAGHSAETDILHNILVMEINAAGKLIWKNEYGGELHEGAEDLILSNNGNLLIAARSNSYGKNIQKAMLIETTSNGKQLRLNVFDNYSDIWINNIVETDLNTFLIGKAKTISNGNDDLILINSSNF